VGDDNISTGITVLCMLCIVLATVGTSYAQENTTTNFKLRDNTRLLNEENINETPTQEKPPETIQKAAYNEGDVKTVEPTDIEDAAVRVNKFIQEDGRLPKYVSIKNSQVNMPEYLYLLTASLTGGDTIIRNVELPKNSTGNALTGSIELNDYLELANRVYDFIKSKNRAPSYATYHGIKIRFESLVWLFTKAINFKVTNQRLPNHISLEKLNSIGTYVIDNNNPGSTSGSAANDNSVTINAILNAAVSLKSFIEQNQRLPTYVQVANQKNKPRPIPIPHD